MLGTVPTSIPQFILLGNWLLEGNFRKKFMELKNARVFWILASVWFVHVFGLLYTTDLDAGWDDVRTKIPLVFLPLIYFTTPVLKIKEMQLVLQSFLAGSFINVSWCIVYRYFIFSGTDIREVSRFMSHIRLGFLLCLAIAVCLYLYQQHTNTRNKWIYLLGASYFVFSIYVLGLASGFLNLIFLGILFLMINAYRKSLKLFLSAMFFIVLVLFTGTFYIVNFYKSYFTPREGGANIQLSKSPSGRPYSGYEFTKQLENGNLATRNIQEYELQKEWNRRVPSDSFNLKLNHNSLRFYTLIRFLSSKGLPKDSVTVHSLSAEELDLISKGVCNALVPTWPTLKQRLYEFLYELYDYNLNGTINGHSYTMRYFYLQAGINAIIHEWPFGCGTGDVQQAMYKAFKRMEIPLNPEWQKRPHNQFITVALSNGVHGFIFFIVSLLFPIVYYRKYFSMLYVYFFVSVLFSFLMDDTLETQTGLSFYAVFNTVLLSQVYFKKKQTLPD